MLTRLQTERKLSRPIRPKRRLLLSPTDDETLLFPPESPFERNLEEFFRTISPFDFTPLGIDLFTDEVEELIREELDRHVDKRRPYKGKMTFRKLFRLLRREMTVFLNEFSR